jgi:hypothetical protein
MTNCTGSVLPEPLNETKNVFKEQVCKHHE